jgi:hypothetical protein
MVSFEGWDSQNRDLLNSHLFVPNISKEHGRRKLFKIFSCHLQRPCLAEILQERSISVPRGNAYELWLNLFTGPLYFVTLQENYNSHFFCHSRMHNLPNFVIDYCVLVRLFIELLRSGFVILTIKLFVFYSCR